MSATELLLVRHAEAWCNVEDIVGGPLGCRGLTPLGHDQAKHLAARLREERIDVLCSSPRRRAVETAEALGLPVDLVPDLREQDLGTADGHPRALLHGDFAGNPVLEPWRVPAPGAESWSAYVTRIGRTLSALTRLHAGRRILLVTHGEAVNAAHHVFFRLPEGWPGPLPLTVENTGVTRWREEPWDQHRPRLGLRWTLTAHNDTAHLPL
ncbi:histidine phosphatase family protein [Streptomyces acidiscabies]|uniref:histidine phosphatase family protein n=1 Tax=Streptomyces acidiscabies TaxID=42234 RepID=UPI00073EF971|nr:histidine phosphatase family protein [Streptomyces acidiscabies]GAQ51049.1 putative phosphoserine phosphatase 2 [Streptomyces acidiscabies]